MNVLSLSDTIVQFIYSPSIKKRFVDVDLILACGDLPYYYQEYAISMLDKPLFFVRGNHDKLIEYGGGKPRRAPAGGVDLHVKHIKHKGWLFAGVEGSLRYRPGPFQYTQEEMWLSVFRLVPGLFANKILHGRYLDIFVTHAPPEGIHDQSDLAHQGIRAFRWLIDVFQPGYHYHGHVHIYRPDTQIETRRGNTLIVNTFGYQERSIDMPNRQYTQQPDSKTG
jgi:Icc-related predicted phosphoesterase